MKGGIGGGKEKRKETCLHLFKLMNHSTSTIIQLAVSAPIKLVSSANMVLTSAVSASGNTPRTLGSSRSAKNPVCDDDDDDEGTMRTKRGGGGRCSG